MTGKHRAEQRWECEFCKEVKKTKEVLLRHQRKTCKNSPNRTNIKGV